MRYLKFFKNEIDGKFYREGNSLKSYLPALFIIVLSMFFLNPVFGEEPQYPFVGKVLVDNLNIRSGSNKNFPSIYKLKKDSKVVVRGGQYGWYKVEIPEDTALFIAKKYISLKGAIGELNADKVTVRCRPSGDSSVITLLNKGDIVAILGIEDALYYKIKPPFGSCGWVMNEYIKFENPYTGAVKKIELKSTEKTSKSSGIPEDFQTISSQ